MSCGTIFKVEEAYIVGEVFRDEIELDTRIEELHQLHNENVIRLTSLAVATPKDITPTEEDPLLYVSREVEELLENNSTILYKLTMLKLLKENWTTHENDI